MIHIWGRSLLEKVPPHTPFSKTFEGRIYIVLVIENSALTNSVKNKEDTHKVSSLFLP
jgi:hypothetical protein